MLAVAEDGTPILVEKIEPGASDSVHYTTVSGAAASSLIQLSRTGATAETQETILIHGPDAGDEEATVVQMEDDRSGTGYILYTTTDNEQKLVRVDANGQVIADDEETTIVLEEAATDEEVEMPHKK